MLNKTRPAYSTDKRRRGHIERQGKIYRVITQRRRLTENGSYWEPRWPMCFTTKKQAQAALENWLKYSKLETPVTVKATAPRTSPVQAAFA